MTAAAENSNQDGYWEPEHGPFTKLNHFYQRQLIRILQLTASQQSMIGLLIDEAIGWHVRTARISNQEFADHARVSVSKVIRDKKILYGLGILVVVEQGTGRATSEYTLNLDCVIDLAETAQILGISKAQLISDIQAGRIKQTDRPALRIVPAANPPQEPTPSPEPEKIDNPASEEKKSPEKPAVAPFRVVTVIPPPKRKEASSGGQSFKIKTNIDLVIVDTPLDRKINEQKRKAAIAAVCSLFRKFFQIEIQRKHWRFAGKCVKVFGAGAVLHKIKIATFQLTRGVKVTNPEGWIWCALVKEYGFSKYDTDKMAADEKWRLSAEASEKRTQEAHEQKDKDDAEWESVGDIESAMTREKREAMERKVDEAIDAGIKDGLYREDFITETLRHSLKLEYMKADGLL